MLAWSAKDRQRKRCALFWSQAARALPRHPCLSLDHDPRLFYVQSRWKDEAAFQVHAALPHAVHFIQQMESLLDQPAEFTDTELLG